MVQQWKWFAALALTIALAGGCEENRGGVEAGASATAPAARGAAQPSRDDRYTLVSPGEAVSTGRAEAIEVAIKAGRGLKINHEFPWTLQFESGGEVEVATRKVASDEIDLGERVAKIPLQIRAAKAGAHELVATGNFSVCNDATCYVLRDEKIRFEIAATAGSPSEPEEEAEHRGATGVEGAPEEP